MPYEEIQRVRFPKKEKVVKEKKKIKVRKKAATWTEDSILDALDRISGVLDMSESKTNKNQSVQAEYLSWREVCRALKINHTSFLRSMRKFMREGDSRAEIAGMRADIDSIFASIMTEGALRNELNTSMVKHRLINNHGELTERTESKNINLDMNIDIAKTYDSFQLSEMLHNIEEELKEFASFFAYHKTTKTVGKPKNVITT